MEPVPRTKINLAGPFMNTSMIDLHKSNIEYRSIQAEILNKSNHLIRYNVYTRILGENIYISVISVLHKYSTPVISVPWGTILEWPNNS